MNLAKLNQYLDLPSIIVGATSSLIWMHTTAPFTANFFALDIADLLALKKSVGDAVFVGIAFRLVHAFELFVGVFLSLLIPIFVCIVVKKRVTLRFAVPIVLSFLLSVQFLSTALVGYSYFKIISPLPYEVWIPVIAAFVISCTFIILFSAMKIKGKFVA